MMKRSAELNLKFATPSKIRKLTAVLERYRGVVNAAIRCLEGHVGRLGKDTFSTVSRGHLSEKYKAHACYQAAMLVRRHGAAASRSGRRARIPRFRGDMVLSNQLATLTPAQNSTAFDLWLRVSTLTPRQRIDIPVKATKVYRKWMAYPGAKVHSCAIGERAGQLYVRVQIEIPEPPHRRHGSEMAVDVDTVLQLARSNTACEVVQRRRPGSRGWQRACRDQERQFNEQLNRLPWVSIKSMTFPYSLLMSAEKSRSVRQVVTLRTVASVLSRIRLKAQEHRVRCE